MIKLTLEEYDELKGWLDSHYKGCPMTVNWAHDLACLGYPVERHIPELEAFLLQHTSEYCDEIFDKMRSSIEIIRKLYGDRVLNSKE